MNSSIMVWSGGDEQKPLVVSLPARLGVPSLRGIFSFVTDTCLSMPAHYMAATCPSPVYSSSVTSHGCIVGLFCCKCRPAAFKATVTATRSERCLSRDRHA